MEPSLKESTQFVMEERCILFRGRIVHRAIDVETAIELFISTFFCHDKQRQRDFWGLIATATDRVSFNSKAGILGFILKQYYPEFLVKYPRYLEALNNLIEIRNIVAHRKLDLSDERIEKYDGNKIYIKWTTTKRGKARTEFLELDEYKVASTMIDIMHLGNQTHELLRDLLNQRGKS